MATCRYCGARAPAYLDVCKECQVLLDRGVPDDEMPVALCTHCGAPSDPGSRLCGLCLLDEVLRGSYG